MNSPSYDIRCKYLFFYVQGDITEQARVAHEIYIQYKMISIVYIVLFTLVL